MTGPVLYYPKLPTNVPIIVQKTKERPIPRVEKCVLTEVVPVNRPRAR